MNKTIAGQLLLFAFIGVLLVAASLYLGGDFDSLGAVREFVQQAQA